MAIRGEEPRVADDDEVGSLCAGLDLRVEISERPLHGGHLPQGIVHRPVAVVDGVSVDERDVVAFAEHVGEAHVVPACAHDH